MSASVLNPETFRAALVEAIAEKGEDYVYPRELRSGGRNSGPCQYTVNGKAACVIGVIIEKVTGTPYVGPNGSAIMILRNVYAVPNSSRLSAAADRIQRLQDSGSPWGSLLAEYDKHMADNS